MNNFYNYKGTGPNNKGEQEMYGKNSGRTFQSLDGNISGKSVVIEKNSFTSECVPQDIWPYNLADYLKNFIGKTVRVEYVLPNGRFYEKRGELKTAGTNFIGIRPMQSNDLLLLDMNSIKSINISDFQSKKSGVGRL